MSTPAVMLSPQARDDLREDIPEREQAACLAEQLRAVDDAIHRHGIAAAACRAQGHHAAAKIHADDLAAFQAVRATLLALAQAAGFDIAADSGGGPASAGRAAPVPPSGTGEGR